MPKYIFNARDIAAYIKWFSVPSYLEVSYMQYIFNIGDPVLARPLAADFEKFKTEVYRQLYYLWANGFEGERSDISNMVDSDSISLVCDPECINLESYMKLVTLHLIYTKHLPYVKINFAGLPLSLGIRCDYSQYEENVVKAVKGFNLVSRDMFGKPFDLKLGVPDELLQISLSDSFKAEIIGGSDIRDEVNRAQKEKMNEFKENSLKEFGSIPATPTKRRSSSRRSQGEKANRHKTSAAQPKGIPLEERRHKDGEDK